MKEFSFPSYSYLFERMAIAHAVLTHSCLSMQIAEHAHFHLPMLCPPILTFPCSAHPFPPPRRMLFAQPFLPLCKNVHAVLTHSHMLKQCPPSPTCSCSAHPPHQPMQFPLIPTYPCNAHPFPPTHAVPTHSHLPMQCPPIPAYPSSAHPFPPTHAMPTHSHLPMQCRCIIPNFIIPNGHFS
jgi:hypothetical protein